MGTRENLCTNSLNTRAMGTRGNSVNQLCGDGCNFCQSLNRCDRQGTLHHLASLLDQRPEPALTPTQGSISPKYAPALAWIHWIRRRQSWISHLGFLIATTMIQLQMSRQQNMQQYHTPGAMSHILSSHRRSSVRKAPPYVLDKCRLL